MKERFEKILIGNLKHFTKLTDKSFVVLLVLQIYKVCIFGSCPLIQDHLRKTFKNRNNLVNIFRYLNIIKFVFQFFSHGTKTKFFCTSFIST